MRVKRQKFKLKYLPDFEVGDMAECRFAPIAIRIIEVMQLKKGGRWKYRYEVLKHDHFPERVGTVQENSVGTIDPTYESVPTKVRRALCT
jgi:hypothetical protein